MTREYTPREWQFLRLSALLSGYFLRRHFNQFIGKECGELAQRFLRCGIDREDFVPIARQSTIYHIASSGLYRTFGESYSRNRREHEADCVRQRLLMLDFALQRPEVGWLLTEREKVEHLMAKGLSPSCFPSTTYGKRTRRYFADRQPIGVGAKGQPVLAFVDEGIKTYRKWEVFLKAYRDLMRSVPSMELVFSGYDSSRFERAREIYRKTIVGESNAGEFDTDRLVQHFFSRKLFDEKRFDQFDQVRLDQFREDKRVFAGEQFDALYARWLREGTVGAGAAQQHHIELKFEPLPHRYQWLSPMRVQ